MHNLSLRNKIILILTLPIIAILFLSGETLLEKLNNKKAIEKTSNYFELSLISTKLLNSLKDEREFSLLFINTSGKNYSNELSNNIKYTNLPLSYNFV